MKRRWRLSETTAAARLSENIKNLCCFGLFDLLTCNVSFIAVYFQFVFIYGE